MSHPYPIFGMADNTDDDGQVIDSLLIESNSPPPIEQAIEPIPILGEVEIPKVSRILSGVEIIKTTTDPMMLLPADFQRREFQIFVSAPTGSATATDFINVSDDLGAVSNARMNNTFRNVFRIRAWYSWDLDAHNGPIYISGSFGQTLDLEVSWRAVTV